ncbi:MAG: TlpA family protein disulfide reductase [Bacteroides sp.]|nr:TlpA family protein disulfide reductase [Bacteroides sp.]
MKKTLLTGLTLLSFATMSMADVTVKLGTAVTTSEFDVEYGYLKDMVKPESERPESQKVHKTVTNGEFTLPVLSEGAAQYVIPMGQREYIIIYTNPGEELTVNVESANPLVYNITGSQLMSDIADLDTRSGELLDIFRTLSATGSPETAEVEKLKSSYDKIFTDYIKENPDASAVPYAILHLEGEDFMTAYNNMSEAASQSPLAIFLEPQKERVQKQLDAERRKAELMSGNVLAPDFTFNDIEGNPVSLSDFLGKWVIIDFWGTWCPWCIKGFPELKEAYKEYSPRLEILGVACNDEYDAWKNGVKKYDLPWVNVYNPEKKGGKLLEDYAVEGFPTKALINPEGVIVNITVGHNPKFFEIVKEHLSMAVPNE